MQKKKTIKRLYDLVMDFFHKCNEDHIGAFAAMGAFCIMLSLIPFLIFLLTLTKYAPFSKNDVIHFLTSVISFEKASLISGIVNEIYTKTGTTVFAISIVTALWSASRGFYAIVRGFNSVYEIEDTRNYFVVRVFSMIWTIIFGLMMVVMLVVWVFGGALYSYAVKLIPPLGGFSNYLIYGRMVLTMVLLTGIFIILYRFVPDRVSTLRQQIPGAVLASVGWMGVSLFCSYFVTNFENFSFIYGSMAGIMILMLWLNFCMLFVFYGAEFNYFLEHRKHYHRLIHIYWPLYHARYLDKEKELLEDDKMKELPKAKKKHRKRRKYSEPKADELTEEAAELLEEAEELLEKAGVLMDEGEDESTDGEDELSS